MRVWGVRAPFGAFFERFSSKTIEKLRIDFFYFVDHGPDDGAGFAGSVRGGTHAPKAMEDDAGDGVNHRCESGDGEDIARDFNGALFGGALDFLEALGMGHGADVPDVGEDGASVVDEESGKLAVIIPSANDGVFVDAPSGCVVEERIGIKHRMLRGDIGLRAIETDVALTLLLGIVERVGVKEGPDELAADVFEAEFEMSVLVDGVMAAVEGGGADVEALLVGDFFWSDEAWGVAGAGGGDGGVVRMREGVAESDAGRSSFDEFAGTAGVEHAGLGGHVGGSFYTGGVARKAEIRKTKVQSSKLEGGEKKKKNKDNAEAKSWRRLGENGDGGSREALQGKRVSLIMGTIALIVGET